MTLSGKQRDAFNLKWLLKLILVLGSVVFSVQSISGYAQPATPPRSEWVQGHAKVKRHARYQSVANASKTLSSLALIFQSDFHLVIQHASHLAHHHLKHCLVIEFNSCRPLAFTFFKYIPTNKKDYLTSSQG